MYEHITNHDVIHIHLCYQSYIKTPLWWHKCFVAVYGF